jgi:hypothetical protein
MRRFEEAIAQASRYVERHGENPTKLDALKGGEFLLRQNRRSRPLRAWPLIRQHCLVHDKYYRLAGVDTMPLRDPKSHFGAGHQNIKAVLEEAERLGIPRAL